VSKRCLLITIPNQTRRADADADADEQ
jgi:hypothetical protein